jgi:hypothetical protein
MPGYKIGGPPPEVVKNVSNIRKLFLQDPTRSGERKEFIDHGKEGCSRKRDFEIQENGVVYFFALRM